VRGQRATHRRLAGLQTLAFLHVDANATLYRVFLLLAVVRSHVDLALTLATWGRVVAVSSSEFVTFLTSVVVCGRKALKSIRQATLPGSFDSAP